MNSRITLLMLFSFTTILGWSQKETALASNAIDYDRSALYAHAWNLIELNGLSTAQPGMKQAYITFKPGDFNFNRMSGFTGCNFMGGRIELQENDGITFHPDIITYNNCAGSSVESPLINSLLNVDNWEVKNGQLLLSHKGKVVSRWTPSTYTNKNLNGIWQLNYVRDHTNAFAELFPVTNRPSMVFEDGKNIVSGFSGCHEFICPVLINNNTMVFAENTAQDTTCNGEGEKIFLSSLSRVNAYGFKDDQTLVLIADDKPVMAFTRFKSTTER